MVTKMELDTWLVQARLLEPQISFQKNLKYTIACIFAQDKDNNYLPSLQISKGSLNDLYEQK